MPSGPNPRGLDRRALLSPLPGLLLGGALSGCVGATGLDRADTLVVGLETEPRGFDPLRTATFDAFTSSIAVSILGRLVAFDARGELRGDLASALRPSRDGRVWRLELRRGVGFHDGEPFDADAVAFHFRRILAADGCPCRSDLRPMRSVTTVDPFTLDLHLDHPWPALPAALADTASTAFIGSPRAIRRDPVAYARHPVGTGPYRFVEWRSGSHIQVERNPHYAAGPAARLAAAQFRFLPDQESRFAAVRSGDADVIWSDRPDQILAARRDPELEVSTHTGSGAVILLLNSARPPLDDVRVRRALAYATDRPLLSAALDEGVRPPASDPFGAGSPYACREGNDYPEYDLAEARRMLAAHGEPVELTLMSTATPRGRETGLVFQEMWRRAGVRVEMHVAAPGVFTQRALAGQYQVAAWRFEDASDPDLLLYDALHSTSPTNLTGWRSPAADRLLDIARRSGAPQVRRNAYCELSRLMSREMPVIYRSHQTYAAISRRGVRGIPPLRAGVIDVTRAWREERGA